MAKNLSHIESNNKQANKLSKIPTETETNEAGEKYVRDKQNKT